MQKKGRKDNLDDQPVVAGPLGLQKAVFENVLVPFLNWKELTVLAHVQKSTRHAAQYCREFHIDGISLGGSILDILTWFNQLNTRALQKIIIKNNGMIPYNEDLAVQVLLLRMLQQSRLSLTKIDIDNWWPSPKLLTAVGQCSGLVSCGTLHLIESCDSSTWDNAVSLQQLSIGRDKSEHSWVMKTLHSYGQQLTLLKMTANIETLQSLLESVKTAKRPSCLRSLDLSFQFLDFQSIFDERERCYKLLAELLVLSPELEKLHFKDAYAQDIEIDVCKAGLFKLKQLEWHSSVSIKKMLLAPNLISAFLCTFNYAHDHLYLVSEAKSTLQCSLYSSNSTEMKPYHWCSVTNQEHCPICLTKLSMKRPYQKGDLLRAAEKGDEIRARECLDWADEDYQERRNRYDETDEFGNTALMLAAKGGHLEIVELLIDGTWVMHGKNAKAFYINRRNNQGEFALYVAIQTNKEDVAVHLFRKGALACTEFHGHDVKYWAKVQGMRDLLRWFNSCEF